MISISRPVLNGAYLDELKPNVVDSKAKFNFRRCVPDASNLLERLNASIKEVFPIFRFWQYLAQGWTSFLITEIVIGITVAFLAIPQGMANGELAGLNSQTGLYSSIFPVIVYALFGSSRHTSTGPVASISLMVSAVVQKHVIFDDIEYDHNNGSAFQNTTLSGSLSEALAKQQDYFDVAIQFTCVVGILQIAFGLCRLGFLAAYLSEQLMEALTTTIAIAVVSSQLPRLLGITHLKIRGGHANLPIFYFHLFERLKDFNWITFVISLCCMIVLIVVKDYVEPKLRKKFRFPLPTEIVLVIISTLINYLLHLDRDYHVKTINKMTVGLPSPKLPKFDKFFSLLPDALPIAVICFSTLISVGQRFAKKDNEKLNLNQEWLALGAANAIGALFLCQVVSVSLSRSAIQDNLGGQTQLISLVSTIIIICVLQFLAPFVHYVPLCVLGSILVVNFRTFFKDILSLPTLWKKSAIDFSIFVFTLGATIALDITTGFAVGMAFALVTVIIRINWPDCYCLGNIPGSELYAQLGTLKQIEETESMKIFRFASPLYYANVQRFTDQLARKTKYGLDGRKEESSQSDFANCIPNTGNQQFDGGASIIIVLDCAAISFVDSMGAQCLLQTYKDYKAAGATIKFTCISNAVQKCLESSNFFQTVPKSAVYPSIYDAVLSESTVSQN